MKKRDLKRLTAYFHKIVSVVDKSGIVADRASLSFTLQRDVGLLTIHAPKVSGQRPGLILKDGSTLNFWERIRLEDDDSVTKIAYAYHYERPDGFFFRYEKLAEPHPDSFFVEPQRHLHVREEEPRFSTHCTNLVEILGLLQAYFFRP